MNIVLLDLHLQLWLISTLHLARFDESWLPKHWNIHSQTFTTLTAEAAWLLTIFMSLVKLNQEYMQTKRSGATSANL
jgi:hypothetical protein